ncbi:hypothetical protein MLD38_039326 [Melastoma candidum]|uniref:Uncharacterized protein n=1 Tax=Melastoma candidum TaxID=119954 RepID=A0ACB9L2H6_9MYRT|nr:hypothetical protein MLD38_039326 [Melastoma candidum]
MSLTAWLTPLSPSFRWLPFQDVLMNNDKAVEWTQCHRHWSLPAYAATSRTMCWRNRLGIWWRGSGMMDALGRSRWIGSNFVSDHRHRTNKAVLLIPARGSTSGVGAAMDDDEVVATFRGKILKESDLKFLKGPAFITDRLIEAYFAYLENKCHGHSKILLVEPKVASGLSNYTETVPVQEFLNGPGFRDKELVLFPVENNTTDHDGIEPGSHWSLLVYDRHVNLYYHFDSSSSRENLNLARKLYTSTKSFTGSDVEPGYKDVFMPGQTNKYAGGLYVARTAYVICVWYVRGRNCCHTSRQCDCATAVVNHVHQSSEADMRYSLLGLVNLARLISNPREDILAMTDEELVGSTMEEEVLVLYKGHRLTKSDLEFLRGSCHVTDRLINFYFLLLFERFNFGDGVLLISPSISQWLTISNDPDQIQELVSHLDLPSRWFVLFPLSSDVALHRAERTRSLTRWSLLVHDGMSGLFLHFNEKRHTRKQSPKLRRIWTAELDKGFNKYDSGVHTMAMAKIICWWYVNRVESSRRSSAELQVYINLIQGMEVSVEQDVRLEIKDAVERITGKTCKELLK